MRTSLYFVAAASATALAISTPTAQAASGKGNIGKLRGSTLATAQVRLDSASGRDAWRNLKPGTKIVLLDKAGRKKRGDVDDLVRGARVVASTTSGKALTSITIAQRSTGNADCSFDTDSDDGDRIKPGSSFDCSHDYDDDRVDTESGCSQDSDYSRDEDGWSMDTSWDCDFSRELPSGDTVEWDCSFSASASATREPDGDDVDADLDFDCSWEGAEQTSPLWSCRILPDALGFTCVSRQLNQEFGYTIDPDTGVPTGGMDFQRDLARKTPDRPADCSGDAENGYDCSVDGESSDGNCELEWELDAADATADGDTSGDLSYSCTWDD